ncbi:hypothetical protein [Pseudomonas sp. R5(2019)]
MTTVDVQKGFVLTRHWHNTPEGSYDGAFFNRLRTA